MAENPENLKSFFRFRWTRRSAWAVMAALLTGCICQFFTDNLLASFSVGVAAAFLLFLSWRIFYWQAQSLCLMDLQSFLLRCRLLPPDFTIIRRVDPKTIEAQKQEMLDLGYQTFSENEKKLHEARHTLDKFVGTRASKFATELGTKSVWEGELTHAIILFSDVRGFTAMVEKLKPQETVRFLNRMFSEFEEKIALSGGEINKYMGDAILAFFPFPAENQEPAVKKALQTALRMQDDFHRIADTFKEHYSEFFNTGLGIGMVGGDVIMGNLGSTRRMEFTLIGDTVNFASRLCSIAEDGQILIDRDLALIAGDSFRMQELGPVRIKGKSGLHTPYCLLGEKLHPGLA